MGCGCGGARPRVGRALVTSGDMSPRRLGTAVPGMAEGGTIPAPAPAPDPLGVFPVDVEHDVPDGSNYRVVSNGDVAYFGTHHDAFRWQRAHPGRLRTVR